GSTALMNSLRATLDGYNALGSDLDQGGNTNGPQHAARPGPVGSSVPALTEAELAPVVAEAVARWRAIGAEVTAADVRTVITDLPADGGLPLLGYTRDGVVYLDRTAGGFGWYVDPAPGDDAEFVAIPGHGLRAVGGPAAGRMDLLTVVMHEIGHIL